MSLTVDLLSWTTDPFITGSGRMMASEEEEAPKSGKTAANTQDIGILIRPMGRGG